jgi:hypothetical protein
MVDEIINLPTELQFSLLSEEGEVLEEEPIPIHGKKHILLLKSPCIDCAAFVFCFETTISMAIRCGLRKSSPMGPLHFGELTALGACFLMETHR